MVIILNIYNPNLIQTVAENREFNTEKNNLNVTLPNGGMKAIDFNLEKGEEYELVYSIQVKEGLPIDLWLVNEDNYLLLIGDVNFLYFIDGSNQEVSYTKRIVSLKEEGIYKLVMANIYNNQTVTANIIYEIRSFQIESKESSESDLEFFIYPLIIAVVILSIFCTYFIIKNRKLKNEKNSARTKPTVKKKPNKRKAKKTKPKKIMETEPHEKPDYVIPKEKEPEVIEKTSSKFCGFCGEAVSTPFCKSCGNKV